jgi:threonine dehydratase
VPEVTPAAKIEATRGYGAEVLIEGEMYERSYEYAVELAAETGQTFVHPFDDTAIIAGQGTIGLELLEQYPEVDTVLVAIGGGGLISGIGTVLKSNDPERRVIGCNLKEQPTQNRRSTATKYTNSIGMSTPVCQSLTGREPWPILLKRFVQLGPN